MIIGEQYVPFVIPCKPTSPKVKVELVQEDGEVITITYDETIGFTVQSNVTLLHSLAYCSFSLNKTFKLISLYFGVEDRRFSSLKSS